MSWSTGISEIFKPFKKLAVVVSPQVFNPDNTLENCKNFQIITFTDSKLRPWYVPIVSILNPSVSTDKKERTNINAILVITKGYGVRATMIEGQNVLALYNVHVDMASLNTFFSSKSLLIVSVVWNWCCWLLPGLLFGWK